MQALRSQRLLHLERNRLGFSPAGDRAMVPPVNRMGVKLQFMFLLYVIENRHLTISNNDEFLFLKRMEPRNKNMSLYPAGKREKTDGDVGNPIMEVVPPLRLYPIRHLAHEAENDGDVMRRKGPQDVLFPTNFSEIEAVGVNILNPTEFAGLHQFFEFQYSGVVPQQMPHH